jgi:hypothetical protein
VRFASCQRAATAAAAVRLALVGGGRELILADDKTPEALVAIVPKSQIGRDRQRVARSLFLCPKSKRAKVAVVWIAA